MSSEKDVTWDHCKKIGEGPRLKIKCNYCNKEVTGGITRMKHHLARTSKGVAPCKDNSKDVVVFFKKVIEGIQKKGSKSGKSRDVDDDEDEDIEFVGGIPKPKKFMVGSFIQSGTKGGQQTTLETIVKGKEGRDHVCEAICRCLYANALPLILVESPYFKKMIEEIGKYGMGLKPPTYYEVREKFLKREVDKVGQTLEKYKIGWKKTGCTLMSDGWTDGKGRSLTNFLVNSPDGTVFLRSVDTSDIIKNAENLFKLLDDMIKEIGPEHVVQVVTDSASAYVNAGTRIMDAHPHIFWSPCAAHCVDLMLQDIGTQLPTHKETVKNARIITVYIYRHAWVLSLMRKFTKGGELVRAGITRFATSYLTLKSLHKHKIPLRAMFGSVEWQKSKYAGKDDASIVAQIVLGDPKFWDALKYCLKCVVPIVSVLKLVDGDVKPAMGYIHEAMDKCKEAIASNFKKIKKCYEPIWSIIDTRWDLQLHRPLHAAGYFLNPR